MFGFCTARASSPQNRARVARLPCSNSMQRESSSGDGADPGAGYEWPENEHGIFVDDNDVVWIGGQAGTGAGVVKVQERRQSTCSRR